jgi:hypothetical protein
MKNKYLLLALFFLTTEILIAIYAHDKFIRPFFGDFLAVIFVYCFLMIFLSRWPLKVAIGSLLIAYLIETLQYFNFIEITGLIRYKVLAILIGNSFSWLDILAYTIGFITILIIENIGYYSNKS